MEHPPPTPKDGDISPSPSGFTPLTLSNLLSENVLKAYLTIAQNSKLSLTIYVAKIPNTETADNPQEVVIALPILATVPPNHLISERFPFYSIRTSMNLKVPCLRLNPTTQSRILAFATTTG